MFTVNLACRELVFNKLFSTSHLFHLNKLFTTSSSSIEHILKSVDKSEYVRYQFPKCINKLVDIKQQQFDSSFTVVPDIVSVDEESRLMDEIEKSLKRLRYQHDHWDDVSMFYFK